MAITQRELIKRWLVGPWTFSGWRQHGYLRFDSNNIEAWTRWRNRGFQQGTWNLVSHWAGVGHPPIISPTSPVRDGWGHGEVHDQILNIVRNENMEKHIQVLPLNLLTFGQISLRDIKVLEGRERQVRDRQWWYRTAHEAVFTSRYINDEIRERYFISGYDEQEGWIRNTPPLFVCELPTKVKSIAEAYEALKPRAVKAAERLGMDVRRQGDIFLIHAPGITTESFIAKTSSHGCSCIECRRRELLYGRGRILGTDHEATNVIVKDNLTYVAGSLVHRDHHAVHMRAGAWYIAVRNTAPLRT